MNPESFRLPRQRMPRPRGIAGCALAAWMMMSAAPPLLPPAPAAGAMDGADRDAIRTYLAACRALWAARDARVGADEREELRANDPMRTGLVGLETSRLTTTQGFLAAKRTSAHPLWVAVFRAWFREIGLSPGDRVAVGASASFPAFQLAARVAAESIGLEPVVIGSLTASHYGANVESFDLWDMETVLIGGGFLKIPMRALTPGGNRDRVHREDPDATRHVLERMERIRATEPRTAIRVPMTSWESREWRVRVFFEKGRAAAFVNIGGHAVNFGSGARVLEIPHGLILPGSIEIPPGSGILLHAMRQGLPVMHLLNVRGLAARHGIPFDPRAPDFFAVEPGLSLPVIESWRAAAGETADPSTRTPTKETP